jgi:hypothetical protein
MPHFVKQHLKTAEQRLDAMSARAVVGPAEDEIDELMDVARELVKAVGRLNDIVDALDVEP